MQTLSISPQSLREAIRARAVASAYYSLNRRVSLIDVGWRVIESQGNRKTNELAVRVHVRNKPTGEQFESFERSQDPSLIQKEKVPFSTIDIIESVYPLQWYSLFPSNPRGSRFDPLRGGISVSNEFFYNYGTLGCIVEDRESGGKMLLSNWHVLVGAENVPAGTSIFQPGAGDGGWYGGTIARLDRDSMRAGIDAAVAKLTEARHWINDQLDVGPVSGVSAPRLGMHVVKSGRGSGVTHGVVDGIEGDYPIQYGGFTRRIKYVLRIVPVDSGQVSTGGDSGSLWIDEETKNAVALHFAGSDEPETALGISMPQVLDTLNVDIATTSELVDTPLLRDLQPIAF